MAGGNSHVAAPLTSSENLTGTTPRFALNTLDPSALIGSCMTALVDDHSSAELSNAPLLLPPTKGALELPHVYFRFDPALTLVGIQPELNFADSLLASLKPGASFRERQDFIMRELGQIKYLRNAYARRASDSQMRPPSANH